MPNKSRSEEEWREDEALALTLFGYVTTEKRGLRDGLRVTKYLQRGEERPSREAMARLLRSGRPLTLTQDFRDRLADWFDGGAGRKRDHVRNTYIATFIYRCIRRGADPVRAQKKAAHRFGLSHEAIRDIWGKGKNGLGELIEQIDRLPLEQFDDPLVVK